MEWQPIETAPKDGGFKRYQCEPMFRAKVQMLVSRITATVQDHDKAKEP